TKGSLMHIELSESLVGGVQGLTADIIDTPGVRRFLLHDISAENLHLYFREFKPFVGKCSFGMSCSHINEKGCAIKQAVEDGKISPLRYDSWMRIMQELKTGSFED
ncbi:MAG: ribosome small subunit-dependent GTPase A, partial [Treponema sp.]|nr:ribosome small subunit-dependent GTPase A [Treponema sp.]